MKPLNQSRDLFITHLQEKNRAEATIIAYAKDIEQLIDYINEKHDLVLVSEVKREHIEDFLKHLSNNSYTEKTISRKINAIKTFFKHLLNKNVIESDPAMLIAHPKLTPNAPRILSKIEYRALRDTVKDDIRTKAIVEILLQTGVKISELANIQLSHITFGENGKSGSLFVPGTSSGTDRTIPLNSAVQEAIKNFIAIRPESKLDHLFVTKTGKPLLVRNIRATLGRYFKQIQLNDVTVNDLRHTFVAEHLKRGASVLLVSKIAGHKRLTTTENYLKYIDRKESGLSELEEL